MDLKYFNKNLLDEKVEKYCSENQIFGSMRVTIKDKIVYEKSVGYADIEKKIPFDKNSAFSFYSLSKPFCVIGLLLLKDKGLVDLTAHPSKYLSEAKGFDERVTIYDMLRHISGLPDFEQIKEFAEKFAPGYAHKTREHMLELVKYPQFFEPGTNGMYANINMIIPALIIENLTGMPYAEYMKKEVFDPLGMQTAVVDDEKKIIKNRVQGYEILDGKVVAVNKSHDWLIGAGDIVGTIDDVYKLNLAIKHKKLLKEETWQDVLTPSPINSFGMGCTVFNWHDKLRVTHNGGHTGFRTLHVQLLEDDFDFIFLSNSGYGDARAYLVELMHDAFYGGGMIGGLEKEMDKGYI